MKHIFKIAVIIIVIISVNACKKESDFVDDNSNPTGLGYRPVSTNPLRDLNVLPVAALDGASYVKGASIKTEIQFFSESPVKEINFYKTIGTAARVKDATFQYIPAFSSIKRMDTLLIPYIVSDTARVGTSIKLEYEIVNVNSLTLLKTATIKVK